MPDNHAENRTKSGQFAKGSSGNPSGRPKTETAKFRQALADGSDEIILQVIKKAKEGDIQACRLVLDRVCPALRPEASPIGFDYHEADTISDIAVNILKRTSEGGIPIDQSRQIIGALGEVARIYEIDLLIKRIEEIEQKLNKQED